MNTKLTLILISIITISVTQSFGMEEDKVLKADIPAFTLYTVRKNNSDVLTCIKSKKNNKIEGYLSTEKFVGAVKNPEESYEGLEKQYLFQEEQKQHKSN